MIKLGSLPSSVLASVLASAVGLAPINVALAAPPEEAEADEPEEGEEGEEGEGDEGEGDEGEEGEGDEGEGDEGELPQAEEVSDDDEEDEEPAVEDEQPLMMEDLGPTRPPEPTWGRKGQNARDGKGMLITGGIVTGLGAAFIVTSVLITRCDFDSALSCRYGDQRDFLVPTAVAATGLGLLLIGVGVGNRIKYKRWQNWTPEQSAIVPSYVPGGGGIAVVGRF